LSLFYYGRYIIRPEYVYAYGKASIIAHSKRVIMLESARQQVKAKFPDAWNRRKNECKREIQWQRLIKASIYHKICYFTYSFLRLITNQIIAKLFQSHSVRW